MDFLENLVSKAAAAVWGPATIIILLGTGVYLSLGTRFVQFRKIKEAIISLFAGDGDSEGDITPFQALMTSLAATIGIGNIVGVASAISVGGPGAVFWMWVSGAFGGATKFAEVLLALKFRITNEDGEKSGGPMYYISRGMKEVYGKNFKWLGTLFAVFAIIASFGTGNMTQANSVAESLYVSFGVNRVITGIVIAILTALVIIGGVKSIGKITEKLVPFMAIVYLGGCFIAILTNIDGIQTVFSMIFANAFTSRAVGGGLVGSVIRMGMSRGMFSNEAGLGSAPIAHAASKNDDPVKEGMTASLGVFIVTMVVCTLTAFVILASGILTFDETGLMAIEGNLEGAALTTAAFNKLIPGAGEYVITFGIIFFAFSTIIGWYYYGCKCVEFVGGVRMVNAYKWAWIVLTFVGATTSLKLVWNISDVFNGLMVLPNIIGVLGLSPLVFKMTNEYDSRTRLKNLKFAQETK
ncbi:MAG TPA: sodium:alanine symporter family protein [Tissierellia bacterium]|nr:sodium:alanine symporter family protein [Tissierellia bacterium]